MQIRVLRFNSRNPLVGAALLLAVAAIVVALLVFGLMILAGLTVVGAVALLARKLLGPRGAPGGHAPQLDPSREVFATRVEDHARRLPPRVPPGAG